MPIDPASWSTTFSRVHGRSELLRLTIAKCGQYLEARQSSVRMPGENATRPTTQVEATNWRHSCIRGVPRMLFDNPQRRNG